jgi:hypothetical protein
MEQVDIRSVCVCVCVCYEGRIRDRELRGILRALCDRMG